MLTPTATNRNIAIYVHWPFCISKCPYCDFNSHVATTLDTQKFIQAYIHELEYFAEILSNRTITSVYFGGGTPSLAPPDFFYAVLTKLQTLATFAPKIEITMEANPSSAEVTKFKAVKEAGINRLSLGIQSFDDAALQFLGRAHSAHEASHALAAAAQIFDRYSFDLMYALPDQTIESWRTNLAHALTLVCNHISLYQLTIEKGTRFYSDYAQGKFQLPDQEAAAHMYEETNLILSKQGLLPYEISNYALPGHESQHNLTYWKYEDYLGIGAGAHSRFTHQGQKHAVTMWHNPYKWQSTVYEKGAAIQQDEILDPATQYTEKIMMGMRIKEGLPRATVHMHQGIDKLLQEELLEIDHVNDHLRVTSKGALLLNYVVTHILSDELGG